MSEGYNPLRLLTRGLEVAVGRLPRPFLDYPEHEPPSDRAWRVREPPSDCTWSIRSSALTSSFGCVRPRPREARRWRSSVRLVGRRSSCLRAGCASWIAQVRRLEPQSGCGFACDLGGDPTFRVIASGWPGQWIRSIYLGTPERFVLALIRDRWIYSREWSCKRSGQQPRR